MDLKKTHLMLRLVLCAQSVGKFHYRFLLDYSKCCEYVSHTTNFYNFCISIVISLPAHHESYAIIPHG